MRVVVIDEVVGADDLRLLLMRHVQLASRQPFQDVFCVLAQAGASLLRKVGQYFVFVCHCKVVDFFVGHD